MASIASKRLVKELSEIKSEGCPVGIHLIHSDDFSRWIFSIEVLGDSLYQVPLFDASLAFEVDWLSEVHTLQFRFDLQYPISSPAVQFVVTDGKEAPIHPHVYSNGHVCPVLSVIAVCITIQSMLASCKEKKRPLDDRMYVRSAPENPKKVSERYLAH
ncbi:ubiquitin-conjugating enzyme/RWD-like protein [Mycena maculata]|uniref:Ubiquitin-conjugating enzyme/RWD-like protein n=1 Tax=Mycena maculata TaxID=230809 RepID=A0AAD7NRA8_9AGAR|nr:ubiquitin-conjugating enzyme/RWD-like protein [Mycena maculata]